MLFTVVIPVYNSASYIAQTLASIEKASTALDYEILLIDDCSHDVDDLRATIEDFEKVKLIVKDKKSNAAASRNIGFLKSHSRFVFFLDSDDHFISDAIDSRIDTHKECEAGVIFGNFIINRNGIESKSELPEYNQEDLRDYILIKKGDVRSSVLSIDKNFHKGTLFDSESRKHQDWIFAFKCWDNEEKIVFDEQYNTIINFDRDTRMSSSANPKASKYLVENYLSNVKHINKFSENNWRSTISQQDTEACDFFISIYQPQNISGFVKLNFYKVMSTKLVLPLSSDAITKIRTLKYKYKKNRES